MLQEDRLIPFAATEIPKGPWLVFAPHADDESFGMGGSLLLARDQGIEVSLVIMTDGGLGGVSESIVPTREEEAKKAAAMLGIERITFWRKPDRSLTSSPDLMALARDMIDYAGPAAVFFPSPLEFHPDHRAAAAIVWRAAQLSDFDGDMFAYEISTHGQANKLVDISNVMDAKRELMSCYSSQLKENNYSELVCGINRSRTYTLSEATEYAEAFFHFPAKSKSTLAELLSDSLAPYWSSLEDTCKESISVIIRTKDRPHLLREAMQSVVDQVYPNMEIVVVNDGGGDVSTILDEFTGYSVRIEYVSFSQNTGRSHAANAGLERASGTYLIFLDDDDLFELGHLQSLAAALVEHPECRVAYAGVRSLGASEARVFNREFSKEYLYVENYLPIHGVMFHRSLLDDAGCRFDPSFDLYEDWDFWIQCAQFSDFFHVDQVSAVYRMEGDSGVAPSAADPDKVEESRLRLLEKWGSTWSSAALLAIIKGAQQALKPDIQGLTDQLRSSFDKLHYKEGQLAERAGYIANLQEQLVVQRAHLEGAAAETQAQLDAEKISHVASERELVLCREEFLREIDAQRDAFDAELKAQAHALKQARHHFKQSQEQIETLHEEIQKIVGSTSWRVSAPVRLFGRIISWARRRLVFYSFLMKTPAKAKQRLHWVRQAHRRLGRMAAANMMADIMEGIEFSELHILLLETLNKEMREAILADITKMERKPLISVLLPTYNTPPRMLEGALDSVLGQLYPHWELCITDDGSPEPHVRQILERYAKQDSRIKLAFHPHNTSISEACNRALGMAEGEFVVPFDHDDLFQPHALYRIAQSILADEPDMIYTDEAVISEDGSEILQFFLRPIFSLEKLRSHPYIVHMVALRRELVKKIGGFDANLTISQDYDLILRMSERSKTIVHIPEVLYLWRERKKSAGHEYKEDVSEVSGAIIKSHLDRCELDAEVLPGKAFNFFQVHYDLPKSHKVAIIIPTKNHWELVDQCLESLEKTISDVEYDLVVVDHASDEPESIEYFESLGDRAKVIQVEGPFNFSVINNSAVKALGGDYTHYLFCNNDIEAHEAGWLELMLGYMVQEDVGVVGAKLLYPDREMIQHAGVCVGLYGAAEHYGKFMHDELSDGDPNPGHMGALIADHEVSSVTAACLLIDAKVFSKVEGFDEQLAVGFGDVDLCLRVREQGYRVVFCAGAVLIHHESYSRGKSRVDPHPEDSELFKERWAELITEGDPYYHPKLGRESTIWPVAMTGDAPINLRRRIVRN